MKFVKMFLALVGLAVLFVFVRDNTATVVVEFWEYATPEIELFLVLIITFVLGMIVASFGSTLKIMKLKRQLKNAEKNPAEQGKKSKKDKKNKHKKDDAEKVESDTSSSAAGSYAASSATASQGTYAPSSTPASNPATTSTETASPAAQPVKEQIDALHVGETSDAATTDEDVSEAKKTNDEVISLPADETTAEEEDRK